MSFSNIKPRRAVCRFVVRISALSSLGFQRPVDNLRHRNDSFFLLSTSDQLKADGQAVEQIRIVCKPNTIEISRVPISAQH